jgi:hypothetical protein
MLNRHRTFTTTGRPLLLDAPPGQPAQDGAKSGQADRHGRGGSRWEMHGGDQHRDVQDQCACYGVSMSHGSAPLVVFSTQSTRPY